MVSLREKKTREFLVIFFFRICYDMLETELPVEQREDAAQQDPDEQSESSSSEESDEV